MSITAVDILKLILEGYHDGRYLNGQSKIVDFLIQSDCGCHVELVDGTYDHVRIWSSEEVWLQELERRRHQPIISNKKIVENPYITQLKAAIEREDFEEVMKIKKLMRQDGVPYNKEELSVKRLMNL